MDTLLDIFQNDILSGSLDVTHEGSLTYESICESVQEASNFFSIPDPMLTIDGYSTGVYNNIPFTEADDVLIFNRQQLMDMGLGEKDGLDLVMTHECAHRALQGMDIGFDAHQEELCCDYMVGVRAGLNDIDISSLSEALLFMPESGTHPSGVDRIDAMEAGMEFVREYVYENDVPPTFEECLNSFYEDISLNEMVAFSPDYEEVAIEGDAGAHSITFEGQYDKKYYEDKAKENSEWEKWHWDRAEKAIANGDLNAAKDHQARAKSYHTKAVKYTKLAKDSKK